MVEGGGRVEGLEGGEREEGDRREGRREGMREGRREGRREVGGG